MADTDPKEITQKVNDLRTNFQLGRSRSYESRIERLNRLKNAINSNRQGIYDALQKDVGRNKLGAMISIDGIVSQIDFNVRNLKQWMKDETVDNSLVFQPGHSYIKKEPKGVVLCLGAWNFPFFTTLTPLLSIIAAGNTALVKPSEVSTHSAVVLKKILEEADNDTIKVITGGPKTAEAVLKQRFDHIVYTGNTDKGKLVMRAASEHITPCTLELGGSNPVIVTEDANLEEAAYSIAAGRFFNAGQLCIAPEYILVHEKVKRVFNVKLKQVIEDFYGVNPKKSGDLGRLVNEASTKRVQGLLKNHGGKLEIGGEVDVAERYVAPTFISEPDPKSDLVKGEVFGPIVYSIGYNHLNEAIDYINSREKPLSLYIFTQDKATEQEILNKTSSGLSAINHTPGTGMNPNLPFGGIGYSGMGALNGIHGFNELSHKRGVYKKWTAFAPARQSPMNPPMTQKKMELYQKAGKWAKFTTRDLKIAGAIIATPFLYKMMFGGKKCHQKKQTETTS